jgi:lipid A disaccharide synthetase
MAIFINNQLLILINIMMEIIINHLKKNLLIKIKEIVQPNLYLHNQIMKEVIAEQKSHNHLISTKNNNISSHPQKKFIQIIQATQNE